MAQLKLAISVSIYSSAIGFLKTEKGWQANAHQPSVQTVNGPRHRRRII